MKLIDQSRPCTSLPDTSVACEMILRLENPFHVMAWIMMETAIRFSDLQLLRVSSLNRNQKSLSVCQGMMENKVTLSAGLVQAMELYLQTVREQFEKSKRWNRQPQVGSSFLPLMFTDQLLFPAWMITGRERALRDEVIPVAEFVRALQHAAVESGFNGLVQSHTLRHVCASRWLQQGIDVNQLHRQLGHDDLMTTLLMVQALKYGGLTFTEGELNQYPLAVAS